MENKGSQSPPVEISLALRYIIKSTALIAHHTKLRPDDFNLHIPAMNITLPSPIFEFVHFIIGAVFVYLWIEINVKVAKRYAKRWWDIAHGWIRSRKK